MGRVLWLKVGRFPDLIRGIAATSTIDHRSWTPVGDMGLEPRCRCHHGRGPYHGNEWVLFCAAPLLVNCFA